MRDSRDRWDCQTLYCTFSVLYCTALYCTGLQCTLYEVFFLLKKGELYWLCIKYIWVHVWVHQSELGKRGELKHEFMCTRVETARRTLCRKVLLSWACKADENLYVKCTNWSFNPNVFEGLPFSGLLNMSSPTCWVFILCFSLSVIFLVFPTVRLSSCFYQCHVFSFVLP